MPTPPTIHGIKFSADDVRFLDDQAERHGGFDSFVILLSLMSIIEGSTRFRVKKSRLRDFIEPITATVIDVATPNWSDAAQGFMQIKVNMAIKDTRLHHLGKYKSYGESFKKPTGKASQFFVALINYYQDIANRL